MKYAYYPGCSLTSTAEEYDIATRAVMAHLSVTLDEIPDWSCCGASAAGAINRMLAQVLPARNVAIASTHMPDLDVLIPCSACYLNLLKVVEDFRQDQSLKEKINVVLESESLRIDDGVKVRHLLDVLANDVGAFTISASVLRPLKGIRVAPYYGCQLLRPYARFDDPEYPVSMQPLLLALGAEVHDWTFGNRCCGASLMATEKSTALLNVGRLLEAAQGADTIVTVCPMCQMNLEAYQRQAGQYAALQHRVTILYLPQLIGLAFGFSETEIALRKNVMVTQRFRQKLEKCVEVTA